MKVKNTVMRMVVLVVCIGFIASLFGCGKRDKYILDGPGMENTNAWYSFSVSRSGDSYAQHNFHITMTWSDKGYIAKGTFINSANEEEEIILPKSACEAIDALKPGELPDLYNGETNTDNLEEIIILDASNVQIEVIYVDGHHLAKADEDDFSLKVYNIVAPYFEENFN